MALLHAALAALPADAADASLQPLSEFYAQLRQQLVGEAESASSCASTSASISPRAADGSARGAADSSEHAAAGKLIQDIEPALPAQSSADDDAAMPTAADVASGMPEAHTGAVELSGACSPDSGKSSSSHSVSGQNHDRQAGATQQAGAQGSHLRTSQVAMPHTDRAVGEIAGQQVSPGTDSLGLNDVEARQAHDVQQALVHSDTGSAGIVNRADDAPRAGVAQHVHSRDAVLEISTLVHAVVRQCADD